MKKLIAIFLCFFIVFANAGKTYYTSSYKSSTSYYKSPTKSYSYSSAKTNNTSKSSVSLFKYPSKSSSNSNNSYNQNNKVINNDKNSTNKLSNIFNAPSKKNVNADFALKSAAAMSTSVSLNKVDKSNYNNSISGKNYVGAATNTTNTYSNNKVTPNYNASISDLKVNSNINKYSYIISKNNYPTINNYEDNSNKFAKSLPIVYNYSIPKNTSINNTSLNNYNVEYGDSFRNTFINYILISSLLNSNNKNNQYIYSNNYQNYQDNKPIFESVIYPVYPVNKSTNTIKSESRSISDDLIEKNLNQKENNNSFFTYVVSVGVLTCIILLILLFI